MKFNPSVFRPFRDEVHNSTAYIAREANMAAEGLMTLGEEIPWMLVNRDNGADGKSTMSDLRANLHNEHHAFVTPNIFKKAFLRLRFRSFGCCRFGRLVRDVDFDDRPLHW